MSKQFHLLLMMNKTERKGVVVFVIVVVFEFFGLIVMGK